MFKKLLCAATLVAAASAANAASISTTYTINKDSTPVATTVDVAQFDTTLGTLNSVEFDFTGQIDTTITLINQIDKDQDDIGYEVTGNLALSDGTNVTLITLPSISGSIDVAANSTETTGLLTASDSVSGTFTDAMTLALFSGLGNVSMSFDADASSTFTGTGNIFNQVLTDAFGSVKVTYNYTVPPTTPVSAPAHVALLGLGLVAFAGMRKARK